MKKNKIITLGVLIMSTTVFSGTEIDALKDRITKLENNATKVEISGEVSVNFTKGNQDDEAEIGIATSIAAGFNSHIVFSGTDQLTADEITIVGNVKGIDFSIGKQTRNHCSLIHTKWCSLFTYNKVNTFNITANSNFISCQLICS
jgi:hypothetical protein